jgi:Holliday junction resolvase RusA-like endonuclease
MPRKTLKIACLNITIHPNPTPEKYVELFEMLLNPEISYINYHGKHSGFLKNDIKAIENNNLINGFTGTIVTFTDIDPKKPFIDIAEKELVLDENNEPIPQLKPHIKPDGKEHAYVFLPEYHRMIFDCEKISPKSMFKIMTGLATNIDSNGIIFNLEQSSDTVELIKSMPLLSRLTIRVSLPNGDSLRKTIQDKIDDYSKRNIHKAEIRYDAIPKTGIVNDDNTIDWIDMSTSYGDTTAIGKDINGKKQILSTLDSPLVEKSELVPQIGDRNNLIQRAIVLAKKLSIKLK